MLEDASTTFARCIVMSYVDPCSKQKISQILVYFLLEMLAYGF